MGPFEFLVLGLATWRTSCIIAHEDGPAMAFQRLRERAMTISPVPGGLGELVSCPYCVSVWVGGVATICWCLAPAVTAIAALPLALSGVAAAIERALEEGEDEEEPSSLVD